MKKLYFGSNLKMYKGISATREYLQKLVENTKDISRDDIELFIIPSYTTLQTATSCCDREFVRLGAQNMCWEDQGQFTGEISPCMLEEMGLDLVMIGHSERRHVFGESDVEENKKVKAALSHGFKTLLCIGETAEQKEYGISAETLRSQLKIGFYGVSPEECKNIWVAYEPVWSIGPGKTPADKDYITKIAKFVKEKTGGMDIVYGGGLKKDNAAMLASIPEIDGGLIALTRFQGEIGFYPEEYLEIISLYLGDN